MARQKKTNILHKQIELYPIPPAPYLASWSQRSRSLGK